MPEIQLKDAEQDQKIALLEHRIEENEKLTEELRNRIRKNEKWITGAGAIITALITIIGLADALDAKEVNYGSNGSTKQEVLLQFPSSGNK
jgi:hypothetical protein